MENNETIISKTIEDYVFKDPICDKLDPITVRSLFRSCIEPENPELPHSSIVKRDISNPEVAYSLKISNIKLNLRFALDIIIGLNSIYNESKEQLLILLLKVIQYFFSESKVKIDKKQTYVLYAIALLEGNGEGVLEERIIQYAQKNKKEDMITDIDSILKELENLKTIYLLEGKYHLCETVIV